MQKKFDITEVYHGEYTSNYTEGVIERVPIYKAERNRNSSLVTIQAKNVYWEMENLERLYKMGNLWKGESLKRVTSHSDFLLCDKPKKGYKKGEISKLRIFKRESPRNRDPLRGNTVMPHNSTRNQVDKEPRCGCATSKSLFIYFIYNVSSDQAPVV